VEVHLLLQLMCLLMCEGNVIQQLRQQPPWNVCSDLELPATVTCLTYDMLTTAVGLHAHDVAIVHWWFVPKFIFFVIIRSY
jgi:hypothetical protein